MEYYIVYSGSIGTILWLHQICSFIYISERNIIINSSISSRSKQYSPRLEKARREGEREREREREREGEREREREREREETRCILHRALLYEII